MQSFLSLNPLGQVPQLAAQRRVHQAFRWLHLHDGLLMDWQRTLVGIPAPPFGEGPRAAWLLEQFRSLGLSEAGIDEEGNVIGLLPASAETASNVAHNPRVVVLSAHIDTVFPHGTDVTVQTTGSRLIAPGACDNAAGVTGLLAIAAACMDASITLPCPVLFVGNGGEEGEGDLRGMRYLYQRSPWCDRIAAHIVLDGAGHEVAVTEALGSRRFLAIVTGPGGHSWSDFGSPNPIIVLARAIDVFSDTPVPASPKTTFNVGVIRGGTSVNSIPESASMRVDLRSTSMAEIDRLEAALRRALERALKSESDASAQRATRKLQAVQSEVVEIGNRPAGELAGDARVFRVIRAVDAHLGNAAQVQRASTDANVPLSLGREAIAIGGGGSGGGAHTLQEWFDCNGRDLGLKRILLTMLALAGIGE